jgi:hypothetical protein
LNSILIFFVLIISVIILFGSSYANPYLSLMKIDERVEDIEKIYEFGESRVDALALSPEEDETLGVGLLPRLKHDLSSFTVNHVDHNRTIIVTYPAGMKEALSLEELIIYLSNGEIYFSRNIADVPKFEIIVEDKSLIMYSEKIRIKYDEIFKGDYTVGNEEWIDIKLTFYNDGEITELLERHIIEVKSELPIPNL